ncbi:MAG TPA: S41 family peptidase, partial [Gemmatimonadales bacterium]|nr:S41 family peptidase [Gemmatimonadales bacterium]
MRHRTSTALCAAALLAALPGRLDGQASYEQLQTFSSLLNQIRQSYVDSVSYAELVHAAIDGVLSSLDPHSRFLRRADGDRESAYEAGELAGTGIVFDEVDGRLTVLTVIPRSPAARSGVAPGDRLVSINDTVSAGLSQYEVGLRLLGDKGTKVRLLFERGSRLEPDSVRVSLKYDYLEPRSVTSVRMVDATTGYLRLSGFHAKAGEEVERAIKDLKGKGARRLVLDIRGNPGGLVYAAVDVASLFLPKQTLVFKAEGRRPSVNSEYRTEGNGAFRDLPLMVLIDDGSASASEALAGTLQDHDRALLLGRRSFGKALMQQGYPIPPQGDLVYLTVGRIATPSGRVIQRAYHGLKASQYYSFAGRSGAAQDTTTIFHTDHQREVRGGGGIVPDIAIPRAATVPSWWGIAADSGWVEAVA